MDNMVKVSQELRNNYLHYILEMSCNNKFTANKTDFI